MKTPLVVVWVMLGCTVLALEPPRPGELEQYRQDGSLAARLQNALGFGNHRIRAGLARRTVARLEELSGKPPSYIVPPAWEGMPTKGTNKIVALLVDFPNYAHVNDEATITNKLFGDGLPAEFPRESLRNYYRRASYNQLELTGNGLGWYRMQHDRDWYTTQYPNQNEANRAIILEAVQAFDATHDFSQYDNNGDGKVDYLVVLWAGPDNGWGNFWWGYQWSLQNPIDVDGVRIVDFSWQWESNPVGSPFTAMVVIHETGHALGLPDYYDYLPGLGPEGGVGGLDMMDGNHADHNAFSKFMLEWLNPLTLPGGQSNVTLRAMAQFPDALAMMPGYAGQTPFTEFFMIENRYRVNNDTGNPSDGLLIWHVDATLDAAGYDYLYDNSYTAHKLLRLMEADGLEEIETGNGNADAGDYYNEGEAFSHATLPSSRSYSGTNTFVTITNISADGLSMTLDASLLRSSIGILSATVLGGNFNGVVDPNECNELELVLTNAGTVDITGVRVTLSTTTPQVTFGQRTATYPDLPANTAATNSTVLRLSTSPLFVCGTPIDLQVVIKSDQVTLTNAVRLASGVGQSPVRFDNNVAVAIPDNDPAGVSSAVVVTNVSTAIYQVVVSLFLTHSYDGDLTLELISPEGVTNTLAAGVGGSGNNFGLSCWPDSSRTTFTDDAGISITGGVAPFWGSHRPVQPLGVFAGKSGTNVNGTWRLRVVDGYAFDTGTLECWSLVLYSAECLDGGGQCPGVDLAVGMSDSPDPVFIGSNLVYTIAVTNFGPDTAKGVSVVQLLPGSVVFVSATASQGSIGHSGGVVTANLGNLGAGAVATATVVVTPTAAGTISCKATAASAGPETDPANNEVTITTSVRPPTADVAISLADSPDPVLVGQALIYTVTVANNGPSPASGVVVTSVLPSTVVFQSASPSQGNASYAGGLVVASLGTVTNGGSATVAIVVTPTAVGLVAATAQVSANQADPLPANNTASTTTVVGPAADLVVSLTDSPDPVVLRSNLTYVVSVTNRGPSVATGATLTHTLPGGVTVVATNVTQGTVVRNGNVVTASLGALAVGADAQLTVVVTSPNVGTLVSSATATASAADPNLANNTASATTSVLPPFVNIVAAGAKLTAENLSPTNGAVDIGETVTLQLRLRNAGNAPNTNLVATLLATGGVASPSGPQTYGVLAPSGDTVARPFTFTASGDYGGTVTATLQLQDGPNNLGTVMFSFALPVVLTFANTAPITIPDSGAAAPYPSVITVSGVTSLVDKVTVTLANLSHTYPDDLDVLLAGPHGQKTILMSDSGGGNSLSGATIAFDDGGGFLSDEGSIVSTTYAPADYEPGDVLPGTPPSPPAGPYPAALAGCNSGSPNGSWSLYVADDSAGDAGSIAGGWSLAVRMVNPVNQVADLALAASAAPDPVLVADALTYTFTVTNGGPSTATGVSLTNALPAGVTLFSAAASQGTCQTNGSLVVANLGSLALGSTATITVGVVPGVAGSLTNTASVAASENDLNTGNNAATVVTTVGVPVADVGVTKLAAPEPITVGSNLTYTITITNHGPNAALGVVATDTLPAGLTFVSAASSVGTCTNVDSLVTCSLGNLASGAEATVTITATAAVTGSVTNTVSVGTASSDTNPADNMASIVSSILAPAPKIVTAGMALASESLMPANGVPDPGETVTISFALANVGAVDTANLVATLQSSGGVTSLSTPQSYGALVAGGPSGSANFIFTATGPNGGSIVATLQLQDGGNNLGSVSFTLPLPTTTTLADTNAITIPDSGGASPYPSSIVVSGLTGLVGKVTVTLNQLSHNFPDDLDLLLVGPLGQRLALMSDAGGGRSLTNVNLSFDDAAVAVLPDASQIVSGTFKPTDYEPGEVWPAPAPAGVTAGALSVFNGTSPNGTWSLYVADDSVGDAGQIAGGWSLAITTVEPVNPAANLEATATAAPASVPVGSALTYTLRVTNLGPATATGVVMTDPLPLGLSFLSVSTSQGAATNIGGTVTCDFGSLSAGAGAIVTVQVTPTVAGWLTNTFSLSANELDLNPGNNVAQAVSSAFNMMPARLAIEPGTGGQYVITLTGQPGLTYVIQASTDLSSWLPVFTDKIAPNGTLKYTITNPESFSQRYYRGVFTP